MSQQIIISIGREFGSGGHEIAEKLAARYGFPMYDRSLLKKLSEKHNMELDVLKKFDEKPKNIFLSRTEKGLSSSPEQAVAKMQFDFLRDKAASGESFVVVGRCAETVLKDYKGLVKIFVNADMDMKLQRTMESYDISEKKARLMIREMDKRRKQYHNSHSDCKWGKAKSYDLTINSSRMGIDGTVDILARYIEARRKVIASENTNE
ncbi:MAG: cytidylate kinase-like family protein [Lachnospiraceae bacterium]|nr:cytidylate kinase-like family protein [Lachnospiraceae bacterium]